MSAWPHGPTKPQVRPLLTVIQQPEEIGVFDPRPQPDMQDGVVSKGPQDSRLTSSGHWGAAEIKVPYTAEMEPQGASINYRAQGHGCEAASGVGPLQALSDCLPVKVTVSALPAFASRHHDLLVAFTASCLERGLTQSNLAAAFDGDHAKRGPLWCILVLQAG